MSKQNRLYANCMVSFDRVSMRFCLFNKLCVAILLSCIVSLFSTPAIVHAEEPPLRFNSSVGMPFTNPENTGFEDLLLKEIFRRLDRDVVVKFVPAERAMLNLDQGLDDGCLSRINGLEKTYPNIKQIKEISLERDFMAFSKSSDLGLPGWKSLKPFNVAFIRGWKILERNVTEAKTITQVKDGEQLFRLLANDRVDVVIYNRWGGLQMLKQLGIQGVQLNEPSLISVPHYFYLNKKHAQLAPAAAKALKGMKNDGTYQRIVEATLNPLAQ